MDNDGTDNTTPLGVDPVQFELVSHALKGLRDEGKFTVLLTRAGLVRIVGSPHDLRQSLPKEPELLDAKTTQNVLAEIGRFCQVSMFFNTEESTLQFLEENIYDDNFTGKSDEEKTTLRGQLKKKLGVAIELLPSDVKQRRRRLQTATDACLEDVDVEVVRERRDECSGRDVAHPFLRLRVRYTDAQGGDVFPYFFAGPWGDRPSAFKSFSLECDELDIDVLLFRLTAAKQRLLDEMATLSPKQ